MHERDVLVGREPVERHAPRPGSAEGLEDGERAVREDLVGREQIDVDIVLRHVRAEEEARLERGHAATGDEHARSVLLRRDP